MSELISVIMVVRNEERHVSDAVRSVLAQTYANLELLVVDGRSSDSTRDVVLRLVSKDPRVRLLDNPEKLISSGLNIGLENATGSYVARLDGHSRWAPRTLSIAVRELEADPRLAGVGGLRVGVAASSTGKSIAMALSSKFGVGNSIYHYAEIPCETDHITNGVYRREALVSVGGWDPALIANEDVDVDFRIIKAGWGLRHQPEMLTLWNVRETLPGLFRQYRRYGRAKSAMVRKNGVDAVRARHLAPPGLVVLLTASLLLSASRGSKWASPVALYAVGVLLAGHRTVQSFRREATGADGGRRAVVGGAFAAMHTGWGVGFLEGLVLRMQPFQGSTFTREQIGR